MSNIETLTPMYTAVMGQIQSIDEQLDAASGGKSAGKRALINSLVAENEEPINSLVSQLFAQVFEADFSDTEKVAFYYGITSGLKKQYEETAVKVVEALVADQPEAAPIPDEDLKALSAARSKAFKEAKYVRELLTMFGADPEMFPMPKRRGGGARGKRGERAISKFTWTLDGDRMLPADDSLTAIAKKLGFAKAVDLRNLLREAGIDLTNPADPIEFTLSSENSPDSIVHVIVGNKRADEDDDDDDDDENGEDADDDTEE